jgi:hypothetical protein
LDALRLDHDERRLSAMVRAPFLNTSPACCSALTPWAKRSNFQVAAAVFGRSTVSVRSDIPMEADF